MVLIYSTRINLVATNLHDSVVVVVLVIVVPRNVLTKVIRYVCLMSVLVSVCGSVVLSVLTTIHRGFRSSRMNE